MFMFYAKGNVAFRNVKEPDKAEIMSYMYYTMFKTAYEYNTQRLYTVVDLVH